MRDRSQMGSTGTGSSREVDNSKKAIGFDAYNQVSTGGVAMSIRAKAADNEHIPTVFTLKVRGGCEVDSLGKKAGKGALINKNKAMTLGVSQDQTLFVPKFLNSSGGA